MKPETYVKRYGGSSSEWENVLSSMRTPMTVISRNNRYYCPICGHSIFQFKKCSYCGQTLKPA